MSSPDLEKQEGISQYDCKNRPDGTLPINKCKDHENDEPKDLSSRCESQPDEEAGEPPILHRTVSTQSQPVSVERVPLRHRAGLLAKLSILYEAEEPKDYPRNVKWFITFIIGVAAFAAPMGSAIILPSLGEIARDFGATPTVTNLSVALYMLAMSLFPLWWSSFSETAGRRTIYITSFAVFVLWNVLAAVANSIGMFIVMRFLAGGAAAAVQAVGAGTVADCWEPKERGKAMGVFYLGPLCGPLISPLIGGALDQAFGWRSTQWFGVIYGGVTLALLVFGLPETHRTSPLPKATPAPSTPSRPHPPPRTPSRASLHNAAHRTRALARLLHRTLIQPLHIILYLRFPAVALTVYYASIAFGSLYFLNISIEKTFSAPPYNFSPTVVGAFYLFNSTGYLLTSLLGGRWTDHIMARSARRAGRVDPATNRLHYLPEDRMRENVWTAALVMPAALLWYGWSAELHAPWPVPMVANLFFGAGSMLLFAAATTMLTEFMPRNASNGVALNNCVRNVFSFVGTFAAEPGVDAIGNGWLFTILAGVAAASCGVVVAMRRCGPRWRADMDRRMG